MNRILLTISILMVAFSSPVSAYIGPGLGAGTVGVILGVLGSILLALFAIFWYPIKRLFKLGKKQDQPAEVQAESEQAPEQEETGKE